MSTIHPFRAIRPHPPLAAEISCPPYDVISTAEARDLAQGLPDSYLHVIRPEIDFDESVDPHAPEVYEQGRVALERLLDAGHLVEDEEPAFFAYRLAWRGRRQLGLVCTVDAAEYRDGRIRKHEKTRPDKEDDRTQHLLVSSVHAEGVFLAFRDDAPTSEEIRAALVDATSDRPLMHFVRDEVTHTLWRIRDTERFTGLFAQVPELYIADGHHRSAAGERAATDRAAGNPDHTGAEEYNRILAAVFPEGELAILPYHRIVKDLNGLDGAGFLARLAGVGELTALDAGTAPDPGPGEVAVYLATDGPSGGWHLLAFPPDSIAHDDPIASLDVALLQDRVLAPILGVGDPRTDPRIDFVGGVRGTGELERRVDSGDAAIAFAMHATSMAELLRVADANEIMPPKSTWFEPKLRSGLFAHRFETARDTATP